MLKKTLKPKSSKIELFMHFTVRRRRKKTTKKQKTNKQVSCIQGGFILSIVLVIFILSIVLYIRTIFYSIKSILYLYTEFKYGEKKKKKKKKKMVPWFMMVCDVLN